MRRSSPLRRALRAVHHAVFHASREGRAAEIAAWSNAAAAVGAGAGAFALSRSWPAALATALAMFVPLRVALAHRVTVWVAALLGTLAVAATSGGLAWVFAHVLEAPSAPPIAAVLGALAGALAPAWAYGRLAQRRLDEVPDSLLEPVSLPPSHR